jgi:hypothetical protein
MLLFFEKSKCLPLVEYKCINEIYTSNNKSIYFEKKKLVRQNRDRGTRWKLTKDIEMR